MEPRELEVEVRESSGSAAMRRLRNTGKIPAVVYSESLQAVSLVLDDHGYRMATRGVGRTQLFKLKSADGGLNGLMTIIKEVQIEPLKGKVLHVDLVALSAGHTLTVSVPVKLIGECAAVKEHRALLNQNEYEIEVECLPDQIPGELEIDITPLKEGGSLHASDVKLPAGVRLRSSTGLTIVSAISKKALEAQEAAEAAATAAAQAAAAPAATPASAPADKKEGKK